jgi:hypothetical protein
MSVGESQESGASRAGLSPSTQAIGAAEGLKIAFTRDPRFVLCVTVLTLGLLGVQWLVAHGFRFSKERLDLRAPLQGLNRSKIVPYRLVGSDRIPKEEVEALGTEEYIRWRLEDTSVSAPGDPLRWPTLFVTYYSGQPDQVPHVPEECFLGGGYQQLTARDETITVPGVGAEGDKVPIRILTFQKQSSLGGAMVPTVVYLFHVNGRFVGSRTAVRWMLGNPFERYAYFSKVEVCFGRRGGPADEEIVRKAAERLLRKILPLLVQNHWPEWPPKADAS